MEYNVFQNNTILDYLNLKQGWELYKFSDLLLDDTKNAKKIKKDQYLEEGKYPIVDQGKSYIAGFSNEVEGLYNLYPSIIFGDHTRILKYVDFPLYIGADGVKLLKPLLEKSQLNVRYLYYFLNTVELPNDGYSRHFKYLKQVIIPLPNINIQNKIVEILDKAQELIDKRKEQIEQLDELVKSRFIEMFGNNNTIFEKWENAIVEEVSEVSVGVVIKPSEYYTEENNGIKTFRSLNVGEMFVKDKDWVYFTKEGNEKNKKSILKEGQVLIVRSGYPGTACVVSKEYEGCNAIDIIIATPDDSKINSTYMCAFTNFPHGKNQILNGQAGAGQKHFNVGSYKKLKIALPPIELQNKFSDFVKQVDKLKFEIEKSLKELEDNFNSLIQKAFKGELF